MSSPTQPTSPGRSVLPPAPDGPTTRALDRAHVFHSWSAQRLIDPMPIAGAEGSTFWDHDGTRYLDFASQLVNANLGHQHPTVVAAIQEQAATLCTVAPQFANDRRGQLAERIVAHAPGDLEMVFFTNGGADANENAVRLARLHTGRLKVLSTYRSYHGSTNGSITLTGDPRRWPNEPGMPGVVHFFGPYRYRSSFSVDPGAPDSEELECRRALEHLEQVLTFEGPHTVAAILLEPVVGTNGVLVPPAGYLPGVRELCDRYGILLIADEVMTGFGRCGEWFAVDRWGVAPDLISFAKGVNSGYIPLGGVLISRRIAETFAERPFPGGLTYSGHPLACASGLASLQVLESEGLVERARRLGEDVLGPALRELAAAHPSVGEVRGLGLFWAIELVRDRATREMLVPYGASGAAAEPMTRVLAACKERGVWPFVHFNRLHVAPPLVITETELKEGVAALDEALTVADGYVDG